MHYLLESRRSAKPVKPENFRSSRREEFFNRIGRKPPVVGARCGRCAQACDDVDQLDSVKYGYQTAITAMSETLGNKALTPFSKVRTDADTEAQVSDGTPLNNPTHERFARLTLQYSASEAYRRALGDSLRATPKSVWEAASQLATRPDIRRRVAELRALAARESAVEVGELARELRELTQADISELIYRGACRYCHGEGHRHQWIDEAECLRETALAMDEGRMPEHSDAGGYGYNGSLRPAEDCPRCFGSGDHWFVTDFSKASTAARRLVRGVGKHGELLLVDPMVVRDQLHRLLGGYIDRRESVNLNATVAAPRKITAADVLDAYHASRGCAP
jgi:phage terminase small subunit